MGQGSETTVFVLLDACRWDYIEASTTPFLWSLTQDGLYVQRIRPSLGFCERTELLSGTTPRISGNFTALTYDPANAPMAAFKHVLQVLSLLDRSPGRRYWRRALGSLLRTTGVKMPLFEIPLKLLPTIALTEDAKSMRFLNALSVETVLDVLAQGGGSFYYDSFTELGQRNGNDDDRVDMLLFNAQDGHSLHLLFLGELDGVGHRRGPLSRACRESLQRVDSKIARVYNSFAQMYDHLNFVVLGDHGMVRVHTHVDVEGDLYALQRSSEVMPGKDFVVFLDSTMVRFWFFSERAESVVQQWLSHPPYSELGTVLSSELRAKYSMPESDRYGSLIWLAKPGVVIFPDYFHRSDRVKGMHGYDPAVSDSQGMLLIKSPKTAPNVVPEARLLDVCPTLCDLLGVKYPRQNQGVSLLAQAG